jgi:hypothetical protein
MARNTLPSLQTRLQQNPSSQRFNHFMLPFNNLSLSHQVILLQLLEFNPQKRQRILKFPNRTIPNQRIKLQLIHFEPSNKTSRLFQSVKTA